MGTGSGKQSQTTKPKEGIMQNIDQIIATGSRWTKRDMDRVYFDADQLLAIFGGRSSRAKIYLNDIDGPKYGDHALGRGTKVYFDLTTSTWVVQESTVQARAIEADLAKHFEQTEETATEEEATTETPTPTPATGWATARRAPSAPRTHTTAQTACTICGGALTGYDRDVAAIPGVHADCI